MYLFFDTETTGIPAKHDAPASDIRNWPRLVQIAWLLADPSGDEIKSEEFTIYPDGFEIPRDASQIHGITTAMARRDGVDVKTVLKQFDIEISAADLIIAHNVQFDERVVGAEFFRVGKKKNPLEEKHRHCTMRSSTDFCRLPGGRFGYKWPTLDELHRKLFAKGFGSAHRALVDVKACAKCFFEMQRKGIVPSKKGESENAQTDSDQELFDDIYSLAEDSSWFDTSMFVDSVYAQFEEKKFISTAQRAALVRIRTKLDGK